MPVCHDAVLCSDGVAVGRRLRDCERPHNHCVHVRGLIRLWRQLAALSPPHPFAVLLLMLVLLLLLLVVVLLLLLVVVVVLLLLLWLLWLLLGLLLGLPHP